MKLIITTTVTKELSSEEAREWFPDCDSAAAVAAFVQGQFDRDELGPEELLSSSDTYTVVVTGVEA